MSSISDINPKNIKKLIDAGTLGSDKVIEEYISGEIKSGSNLETTKYAAVWKGYFVASTTGNYKFRGVADDTFAVYLSTNKYGSK